jgi:hypothetical protein
VIERATLVSLLAVSTAVSTATSVAAQPGKPAGRRDLEEVARSSDPAVATTKPLAVQMLDQITHKR